MVTKSAYVHENVSELADASRYFSADEPSQKKIHYSIARKMEKKFLRKCLERYSGIKLTDKERRKMRESLRTRSFKTYEWLLKLSYGSTYENLRGVCFPWPLNKIYVRELAPDVVLHEYIHWLWNRSKRGLKEMIRILKSPANYTTINEAYARMAEVKFYDFLAEKFPERGERYRKLNNVWKARIEGKKKSKKVRDRLIVDFIKHAGDRKHVHPEEFYRFAEKRLKK